jgi:hypothetical protein
MSDIQNDYLPRETLEYFLGMSISGSAGKGREWNELKCDEMR